MSKTDIQPALFGQKHSSRDYTKAECWGKNQFNSSFPASLVAYMYSKGIAPIYIKTTKDNKIVHSSIGSAELFGIDPLGDNAYYNYEAGFAPYEKFYQGEREHIDLVMMNNETSEVLSGLEVKLTALPDNTTKSQPESEWGTEIVMRPPTICFLVCSICANYCTTKGKERLRVLLRQVPQINHWEEIDEVMAHYTKILDAVLAVASDMHNKQKPLIIQPVWKTEGNKMRLKEDCLDVFVWSNLAIIQMCCTEDSSDIKRINRFHRTIIWIYKMLLDYVTYDTFDYKRIIRLQSYNLANDKAFALPGAKSRQFLKSDIVLHPRISKYEIKNIILGGGQDLLSPERRFDAVLVNSPDIFD
ncbi:MAG: HindVP family restriction endonuclease [Bacteroidales bacterium]|nr:HindVP family restriction endonuclease [Bacteroidales bacterium]